MKMYRDYLKERLGDELLECKEGFATYRFVEDNGSPAIYIVDIYVDPEFRKKHAAARMADWVVKIAKQKGCMVLLGTVDTTAKNATDSIKVLIAYGMSLYRSSNEGLVFKKEI